MPYRYLDDIATADVAFEAVGTDLESVFISSAEAAMNVMVEDLGAIERKEEVSFRVEDAELDLLLLNFINELVFYKDAKRLLLRVESVKIRQEGTLYTLEAQAWGEVLDPAKHPLSADVKAATLHRLSLKETSEGWKATMVLDI